MLEGRRQEREPLWNPQYVLAIIVNCCIATIMYLLITTTALYALDRFRADEIAAGLVSGSFIIGAIIARLVGGKFLDMVGRRRTLLVCMVVCVVLSLMQTWAADIWLLILLRCLHGVAFGAASTAVSTSVLAAIPASRRAEGAGYYGISTTLGSAVGPVLGLFVIAEWDYPALFIVAASWGCAGLAAAFLLHPPERELSPAERLRLRSWNVWTFIERSALPVAGVMLVSSIGFSGVLSFLNPYAESEGLMGIGGWYFLFYAAVAFISRLFVGRLQDRFGDNAVVYPLLLCLAGGLILLWVGLEGALPVLSAALLGFGFGALMPTVQSIVVEIAGPAKVALATSTFFLAADLGLGVGPIIDGALVAAFGYRGMYFALATVALIGVVYYRMTHAKQSRGSLRSH